MTFRPGGVLRRQRRIRDLEASGAATLGLRPRSPGSHPEGSSGRRPAPPAQHHPHDGADGQLPRRPACSGGCRTPRSSRRCGPGNRSRGHSGGRCAPCGTSSPTPRRRGTPPSPGTACFPSAPRSSLMRWCFRPRGGPARDEAWRARLGARPGTAVLLSVAMFRPEKGQRELIEIAAGLPAGLDWQLWLVGDGPARPACERSGRKAPPGRPGEVSRFSSADPGLFYAGADLAVHASWSESPFQLSDRGPGTRPACGRLRRPRDRGMLRARADRLGHPPGGPRRFSRRDRAPERRTRGER